jgi:hypothetical protein
MATDFYTKTNNPATNSAGESPVIRAEFALIETGFGKLLALSTSGSKFWRTNAGGTAVEGVASTGSGSVVLATSPTLVTPLLGTPTSGTLTNCTGLPVASGISGFATGVATFLATPSSLNLKAAVTDETGSGALVFANTPTLVTPVLGTPGSGTLTNCTGLPVGGITGLGTGVATFLATPSSANLAAAITDEQGSAGALVFSIAPIFATSIGLSSGQSFWPDGTSSAPAYSFASDHARGFYISGTVVGCVTTTYKVVNGSNEASLAPTTLGFNPGTGNVQVLTTRRTGYTNPWTGTLNRATLYDPSTVTLVQLAQRVAALQTDFESHGLVGA